MRAKRSNPGSHCRSCLDGFVACAPRHDGVKQHGTRLRLPAAGFARVLPSTCPSTVRGRREDRVPAAPMASRATKSTRVVTTGTAGSARPSLHNGFNGCFVLFPVNQTLLSPSSARCASIVANLTPALGCQNHTTSPSASVLFVSQYRRVHRIPRPTFVTTRTPLLTSAGRRG